MKTDFLKAVKYMEEGVHNRCVDGKCTSCGECCGSMLPLSKREVQVIKRYIKKRGIKPKRHFLVGENIGFDFTCPFLDSSKEKDKCLIYDIRPDICRSFQCNKSPMQVYSSMTEEQRFVVNMWDLAR